MSRPRGVQIAENSLLAAIHCNTIRSINFVFVNAEIHSAHTRERTLADRFDFRKIRRDKRRRVVERIIADNYAFAVSVPRNCLKFRVAGKCIIADRHVFTHRKRGKRGNISGFNIIGIIRVRFRGCACFVFHLIFVRLITVRIEFSRSFKGIIRKAGIERRFADHRAVADFNFFKLCIQSERIIIRKHTARQRYFRNFCQRKSIFTDTFRFGKIRRGSDCRIRKRIRADRFQFPERHFLQIDTIRKRIVAYTRHTRSGKIEQRCVARERTFGNRRGIRGKRYRIADTVAHNFRCGHDQLRAFINILSSVFRLKIGIRGSKIEFRNFRIRKCVFADYGYVLAEAHFRQRGATLECISGNNRRIDIDRGQPRATRKRALAHFHFSGFEFYVDKLCVPRKRADTDRLCRFRQSHRGKFAIFKRIVSDRNHFRRFRLVLFGIAEIILQIALGERPLVDELYVLKIDFRQFLAALERAESDQIQCGRQHNFFKCRQLCKRVLLDGGNAFRNHHFCDRVFADRRLFHVIRRFFIDHVARAQIFFYKLIARKCKRVDGSNAAIVGNHNLAAESSVRVEINTVECKRLFDRHRYGEHVQRRFAVISYRRGDCGSAVLLRNDRTFFVYRGVAVTRRKLHFRKRRIIRIENILQRDAFGRIHRKFVAAAERVYAARRADLPFGRGKRIICFVRLISRQLEFIHRLQRIRSVVAFLAFAVNVYVDGSRHFFSVRVVPRSRKHYVAALLCDNRLIKHVRYVFIRRSNVQRLNPALVGENIQHFGKRFRFVRIKIDRFFAKVHRKHFIGQTDFVGSVIQRIIVARRDKRIIRRTIRAQRIFLDLRYQLGKINRYLRSGIKLGIYGSNVFTETSQR